jgi:Leucine-rich repeat (LRR) protein
MISIDLFNSDIKFIEEVNIPEDVEELILSYNNLTLFKGIGKFKSLKTLFINNNKIILLEEIEKLVNLKYFYSDNNPNLVEYRALGFNERLQQVIMEAARNPVCARAKWISINSNLLGVKYGNCVIGLLENVHPDVDPNLQVEYEIYNTVNGK